MKGFQDLYDEKSTFEENLINYVENSKKLSQMHKQLQLEPDTLSVPAAAENALTSKIIQFIESTVGSANHFEQASVLSESARKSRPVVQDTLSRALQRAGYSKSLKTPPQTVASSMVPLPNTSPFLQSPRPTSTAVSASQPAQVEDLLVLDSAVRFKNYLDSPETVYFTQAVIRLDGKEFTASNCDRAAQAVLLFDSLDKLRVEITNVHGIPTGRLNKLRESIAAKSASFAAFELILNRSKLNKQEIRSFGDMFAKLESVDSIVEI